MSIMRSFCKPLLAGLCMLAAGAGLSVAGSPPVLSPPEIRPAVFDWHGPYGGLLFSVKSFEAGVPGLGGSTDTIDGSGRLAGIVAGYNMHHNRLVYGLEADIGYGQIRGFNNSSGLEADLMGTLRARFGYSLDGNLLFGTAGMAVAALNRTSPVMVNGDTSTHIGWIIGGGFEHAFARRLSGRVEYLYGRNIGNNDAGLRQMHLIRAGVVYHLPK